MAHRLAAIAFLAPDYDEGVAWFRDCLGFSVLEDKPLGQGKRWVVVGDPSGEGARFVIARAEGERQLAAVGAQAGGRVGYFIETDDFAREHQRLSANGVEFVESARRESYGVVAVFMDPWGGKWDLIQPARVIPYMPLQRQLKLWAAVIAAIAVVVNTLGSQLAPFVFGIAIGYLLNPVAHRLQRLGFSRLTASLTLLLAFLAIVAIAGVILVPVLLDQISLFSSKLPNFIKTLQSVIAGGGSDWLSRHGGAWLEKMGVGETFTSDQIQKAVTDLMKEVGAWLVTGLKNLAVGGKALIGYLSLLIVTPVVAFYILIDWHMMVDTVDGWLPRDHRAELRAISAEIDRALAGFLRGQSLVCLFLGLWYGIGLTLIGLDFSVLIGVIGGVLSFIPYVGSLTALVLALSVAIVQKWPDMHLFLMTLGVIGAGQFLEGYVISPKLVGESIGLHPVWLIFALFAFGELFGFTGLLIAVPAAAALGVILRHLIRSYQHSPFYRGRAAVGP
ncbi:MAG: AI-2E family transporter [Pseudomonadota bacterium]|nr:AI-2E family transporter [Pseudomonadota bacterium]